MRNRIYTRINLFPNVSVRFLWYVSTKQPTAKNTATNHILPCCHCRPHLSSTPVALALVAVVLNVVVLDVVVVLACCPHHPCQSSLPSSPSSSLSLSLPSSSSSPVVIAVLAHCHCRPCNFFLCCFWLIVVCEPCHRYSRQCLCCCSRHCRHCYHCHCCCCRYCLLLSPPTLLPPLLLWQDFAGPS